MITDKKLGIKIAENNDEAEWIKIKENCIEENEKMHRIIEMNKAIIVLASSKIKEKQGEDELM